LLSKEKGKLKGQRKHCGPFYLQFVKKRFKETLLLVTLEENEKPFL